MSDHIGIVGVSAPGAALCFETICCEAPALLGPHAHPEVSLHATSFAEHVRLLEAGDWPGMGKLLLESARKLASIGARFVICPDNTAHQALEYAADSPIPWLHIAQVVEREAARQGYQRLAILGTRYLMEGPVYADALAASGVSWCIPPESDRQRINQLIFEELVLGRVSEQARAELGRIIRELRRSESCDAVVLGCTELPLLVTPESCELPLLDSTRLLARAALQRSLGSDARTGSVGAS
jgi:aspartate racemase